MAAINPRRIVGNWHSGIALDLHTTSSLHVGLDEYGHNRFENTYSELGESLHRLKYHADLSTVTEIVMTTAQYLRPYRHKFDLIVPVPPSRARAIQPVMLLAQSLGAALDIPVRMDCIRTTRPSAALKDLSDTDERKALLAGLHAADPVITARKNVLLFDDLFRSGATMNAVTEALMKQGNAAKVHALTVTRTRSNR